MKIKKILLVLGIVVLVCIGVWYFIKNSSNQFQSIVGWPSMESGGVTFQYPIELPTKYIHSVDWPPKLTVVKATISCKESNSEMGITEKKVVNGHEYCITRLIEGAAGSTYTQYDFLRQIGENTLILSFTTRAPQCDNYDDPQKTECKDERNSFDINVIADQMISTAKISK